MTLRKLYRPTCLSLWMLGLSALLASAPLAAHAATIVTTLTPFTGDAATVQLTFDDGASPGDLTITAEVIANPNTGDLRGVWLHLADESLVSGLSVIGADITDSAFDANNVNNLGGGNNLNGGGTPCPCDLGVEIGTSGMGADDIQSTVFTLIHATMNLSVADVAGQLAGARVTSVGLPSGSRNGSSKLSGVVPEPSTGSLLALGLLILGLARRP